MVFTLFSQSEQLSGNSRMKKIVKDSGGGFRRGLSGGGGNTYFHPHIPLNAEVNQENVCVVGFAFTVV